MSKKGLLVIMVAMALILALSACQKSASNAPVTSPTAAGNLPFPTPIPDDALKNILSGTQTAVAMTTKPAGETPAAVVPTKAPAAAIPQPAATQTPLPVLPTATKPAVVVPTATPGHPSSYTLQKGEFPFCIARRYNLSIASLLSLNGLTADSKPAVGAVLKLPADTGWDTGSRALIAHPASYTVKDADTIYTIACAYGDVDPNMLLAANSLKSSDALTTGETLQIP
jgi:LysM repeat protein